jgi:Patatin-like phospholipase
MAKVSLLLALAAPIILCQQLNPDDYYNILSLDGGGIRGLITAQVVEYMENYTYKYSRDNYCISERAEGKISMADLFDMVSGTSTGSLLTTAIVMPSANATESGRRNMYFANDASDIYKKHGKDVFQTFDIPFWVQLLGAIGFAVLGGLIGFFGGMCYFHNREHEKTMRSFKDYIKTTKH